MFSGLSVALVTPMHADGTLNEEMLRKLVDFHVDAGTNCVVPVGTTGESPTLTHDEHDRVIDVVCEQAAGRIKVMAGTGSNCTAEAIRMTKHAKEAGADGSLQVAPYYNKPTQEGFFQHYKAIAEAVGSKRPSLKSWERPPRRFGPNATTRRSACIGFRRSLR